MQNYKYIILLIITILLITGCSKKQEPEIINMGGTLQKKSEDPTNNINVNGSGTLKCKRQANVIGNLNGDFEYYITYEKGIIKVLHSTEKVYGNNKEQLKEFEKAYKNIEEKYKNLKYYDINVIVNDTSVTFDTNINYDKINMKKLIKIENTENEIYEGNKLKLKKWYELSKKIGITCKGVN